MSANLDAARLKWWQNIINHERCQAIPRNITKLLRLTHVQSADVNGVRLSIIAEGDGGNLRFAIFINGGQPPKPLGL